MPQESTAWCVRLKQKGNHIMHANRAFATAEVVVCGLVRLKDFAASFGCCVSQQLLCFGSLYVKSPKNMVLVPPHHGRIWMAPLLLHWSTIPQSHCSSMLSTCSSLGNFRIFDWSNPKRISDTDLTGISREFCKPAAAALQATVLLQEVHDSNTCDMQMSIWTDASWQCSAMSSLQAWGNAGCKP